MKKTFNNIKEFFTRGDRLFYCSLIGPFLMGTIHLVLVIIKFDWILINYCIFSYLMFLIKVWQWAIDKYQLRPSHYWAGIISMIIIIAPMTAAFVLTILYKDVQRYFLDWFIYAYATYGTVKMFFAIKGLIKKNKTDKQFVLSYFDLIGALYAIQMMEFNLIMTFGEKTDNAMYILQLCTQGVIFLFSIFIIGIFIKQLILKRKYKYI